MDVALLIARRVVTSLATLLLVSVIIFAMVELLPGDAASRILGREATTENLQVLRDRLHLDRPALVRYGIWLSDIVQGDLGTSLISGRPVAEVLAPRISNTLQLSLFALLLYLPMTLTPAIVQALRRGKPTDHGLSVLNLMLLSIPDFLLAAIFLIAFVVWIPIFPAKSSVPEGASVFEIIRALTLPACTVAVTMAAYAVRMLRDNLIEVLESDYVRVAELKGLSRLQVLLMHALPNALVPTLNVTALNLAYLIGSVVVVERLFAFPGFGSQLVDALQLRDVPMIEAMVLIASAVYIAANLLADIGTVLLNPRLRRA